LSHEPKYMENNFRCPHCNVLAQQNWFNSYQLNNIIFSIYDHIFLDYRTRIRDYAQEHIKQFLQTAKSSFPREINSFIPSNLAIAVCQSCNKYSIWVDKEMVYPRAIPIEAPNDDLNEEIKSLYIEASKIFIDSPKGAAALLRLALQKFLKQIGKEGKNINNDIKELVEAGLNPKIQKALDLVRVVGNNAVHPGQINLDDNKEIALVLFKVLNMIAEEFITKPKEIDTLYEEIIPDEIKDHIKRRDGQDT